MKIELKFENDESQIKILKADDSLENEIESYR